MSNLTLRRTTFSVLALGMAVGVGACGNADQNSKSDVSVSNSASPSPSSSSSSSTSTPSQTSAPSATRSTTSSSATSTAAASPSPSTSTSTATASEPWSTSTPVKTMPGATRALRSACVNVNNMLYSTNATWNQAANTGTVAAVNRAQQQMRALAAMAREEATNSNNATFAQKANNLANQASALTTQNTGVLRPASYNQAATDVTTYCTGMFPKA